MISFLRFTLQVSSLLQPFISIVSEFYLWLWVIDAYSDVFDGSDIFVYFLLYENFDEKVKCSVVHNFT